MRKRFQPPPTHPLWTHVVVADTILATVGIVAILILSLYAQIGEVAPLLTALFVSCCHRRCLVCST